MKEHKFLPVDTIVKLGVRNALVIDKVFTLLSPHNNKAKLNVIGLSRELPISERTAQRSVKELVKLQYLTKHSATEYELTQKFFDTFPVYKLKFYL